MKILAIDGNSMINRAFYGVRLLANKKGIYTNAIFGFLNMFLKLKNDFNPDEIVFAFDMKAKTFRHIKYDGYKATRKGMPPELAQQFPIVKQIISLLGYTILEQEGFEADDILGTLGKICCDSQNECIIATGDRDALQLVSDKVQVCLLKTKENIIYDVDRIKLDYGLAPKDLIEVKALMGDTSDNIPGIAGIGEKTALSLIQNSLNIDNIYADLENVKATKRIKNLLETQKDNAYLSRELATICLEVPIEKDISDFKQQPINEDELSLLLTDLELFSLFNKLDIKASSQIEDNDNSESFEFSTSLNETVDKLKTALENVEFIDFILNDASIQINANKHLFVFEENKNDVLDFIIKSDKPKRTFMAKKVFKHCFSNNFSMNNLIFDVELAAYLLSASSKTYSLQELALKYLPFSNFKISEDLLAIAVLPQLCDELKKQIEAEEMLHLLNEIELPLCEVLASMEYEGFAIDKAGVQAFSDMLQEKIDLLIKSIISHAQKEFNINSTKELSVVLFEDLGLPAKKKTKTGYSTNVDVLESLKGMHPIIEDILEYRKLTKLQSTYALGLQKVIADDGRIHSTFNQTETKTGRISSTEPNVQNIPIRTELGSQIRGFFIAKENYVLVDADYSQIELRILAHISNDKNMIEAFEKGLDIHSITASQVFNTPLEEVTSKLRSNAKAINFGIVYGIGPYSLSQDINVSVYEAKEYIDEYLKTYSGVSQYMTDIVKKAEVDGYVSTLYNRKRELSDIHSSNKNVQAFAKRVALNTPIQGTAADIIKIAMIKVYNRLKVEQLDAKLILQVHDELIVEAREDIAQKVKVILTEEMENAADLSVKLLVDAHIGKTWIIAKG